MERGSHWENWKGRNAHMQLSIPRKTFGERCHPHKLKSNVSLLSHTQIPENIMVLLGPRIGERLSMWGVPVAGNGIPTPSWLTVSISFPGGICSVVLKISGESQTELFLWCWEFQCDCFTAAHWDSFSLLVWIWNSHSLWTFIQFYPCIWLLYFGFLLGFCLETLWKFVAAFWIFFFRAKSWALCYASDSLSCEIHWVDWDPGLHCLGSETGLCISHSAAVLGHMTGKGVPSASLLVLQRFWLWFTCGACRAPLPQHALQNQNICPIKIPKWQRGRVAMLRNS